MKSIFKSKTFLSLLLICSIICSGSSKAYYYFTIEDDDEWFWEKAGGESFRIEWLELRVWAFFLGDNIRCGISSYDGAIGWDHTDKITHERIDNYCERHCSLSESQTGWLIEKIECYDRETKTPWKETIIVNDPDKIINY